MTKKFSVSADQEGQAKLIVSRGGSRKGAGRKKIGETRRIALTLPPDWWLVIDDTVEKSGRSQADIIRQIMHNTLGDGTSYNKK